MSVIASLIRKTEKRLKHSIGNRPKVIWIKMKSNRIQSSSSIVSSWLKYTGSCRTNSAFNPLHYVKLTDEQPRWCVHRVAFITNILNQTNKTKSKTKMCVFSDAERELKKKTINEMRWRAHSSNPSNSKWIRQTMSINFVGCFIFDFKSDVVLSSSIFSYKIRAAHRWKSVPLKERLIVEFFRICFFTVRFK